ncbi:MAG TPA: signal peptidase II [Trueperaceae bacterium]|nr:signal peptidase II [Trueperaceae bacterium]
MMFLLAAALVAVDQLSKVWVTRNLPLDGIEIPLVPGLAILHTRNNGAAFGMLRDLEFQVGSLTVNGTFMLGVLSAVVAIALSVYMWRNRRRLTGLANTALALVLAGAAGNMVDRLRLGYVVDFIYVRSGSFDFPVFNVADSCVVIGAGLLIVGSLVGGEGDGRSPVATVPAPRRRPAPLEDYPDLPPFGGTPDHGDQRSGGVSAPR